MTRDPLSRPPNLAMAMGIIGHYLGAHELSKRELILRPTERPAKKASPFSARERVEHFSSNKHHDPKKWKKRKRR